MIERKTWALVTNGVTARLLSGIAGNEPANEVVIKSPARHLRDVLSDREGRSQASDRSGRRSAMEPGSDPLHRDMQDFAHEIFERIEQFRTKGTLEHLAIVAAPRMLGVLRDEMPDALRGLVVFERAANLAGMEEADLRHVVRSAVAEELRR